MHSMIFSDNKSELKLELIQWDGDAYISAVVNSHGFSGQSDAHIENNEFKEFCKNLLILQNSLKGKTKLCSMSPDEIDIEIKPSDKLGHMSVSGKIGRHIFTSSNGTNWHCVQFEFEIEPQQLDKAIKIEWVTKYGI